MIIGGSASQSLAGEVAQILDDTLCSIVTKKFPDGEIYVRLIDDIPTDEHVIVIQSTGYPQNDNMMELFFILDVLNDLNIDNITVVSPYLGYSRQERRFKDWECISAKLVSKLIQRMNVKQLISVNLHEESICDLYNIPTYNISAMPAIAEYIRELYNDDDVLVLAPDKGASGFAKDVASILDTDYDYLEKVRLSPEKVVTNTKNISVNNRRVVILDDIISTGGTIVNAIDILKKQNVKSIDVACVHPVLVNDAVIKILSAGASSVFATNSLKSDVSKISLADTIVKKIRELE